MVNSVTSGATVPFVQFGDTTSVQRRSFKAGMGPGMFDGLCSGISALVGAVITLIVTGAVALATRDYKASLITFGTCAACFVAVVAYLKFNKC